MSTANSLSHKARRLGGFCMLYMLYMLKKKKHFTSCLQYSYNCSSSTAISYLNKVYCHTFNSSFEEDFAASTCHHPVVTSWRLVSTNQANFDGRGRLSEWCAEMTRNVEKKSFSTYKKTKVKSKKTLSLPPVCLAT